MSSGGLTANGTGEEFGRKGPVQNNPDTRGFYPLPPSPQVSPDTPVQHRPDRALPRNLLHRGLSIGGPRRAKEKLLPGSWSRIEAISIALAMRLEVSFITCYLIVSKVYNLLHGVASTPRSKPFVGRVRGLRTRSGLSLIGTGATSSEV